MSDGLSEIALEESRMVAALYVERGGVYWDIPGIDPWDAARDARNYNGPHPVVAHPPCNHWCQLASVNAARYETFEIGDDGGCFEKALDAVRKWGGVLEHPAYSLAWAEYRLPVPGHGGWTQAIGDPGWSTSVSQVAYGHQARKRTWLYAVNCELPNLNWSEPPAEGQVGSGPHPGNKALRLQGGKSSVTPIQFRDMLISMARSVVSPDRVISCDRKEIAWADGHRPEFRDYGYGYGTA